MLGLLRYLKPYKKQLVIGPLFKLSEAVLELLLPLVMARLIDIGIDGGDQAYIYKAGAVMLAMSVLGLGFALICQYYASLASQGYGTDLRNAMFRHISGFSHSELDKFGTVSLTNRMTNDVNQLQFAVAMLIRLVIRAPFLCVGAVIAAMLIDFKLSVVILTVVPVFVLALALIMRFSVPLYRKVQEKLDNIGSGVRENLSGVRVIRAFARENEESRRLNDLNGEYRAAAEKVGRLSALSNPMTMLIMNIAILFVIWFGGVRVNVGALTQGEVIAFIDYIAQILAALTVVANLVVTYTKAYASANRVAEVMDTAPTVSDNRFDGDIEIKGAASLSFKNVTFSYSENAVPAVNNISLDIKAGETVGIVGMTGSGKSTLVNLISRFYDLSEGEILLNGVNINDIPLKTLRRAVGQVPQQSTLFSGTVFDNLRMGDDGITESDMIEAAEIAQADEFIRKMPNGYDTFITRGGTNLSGGQRQRLTIARALAKKPSVLIMDDSSSALDYYTESKLRAAINNGTNGATVIIISQRAATVRQCDKIAVLSGGRLAAFAPHDDLIDSCEIYRDICCSQSQSKDGGAV